MLHKVTKRYKYIEFVTGAESIREKLLARAIAVIEETGEVGIRTHAIAADCGVTAPILYRIFGDREGLIVAAQSERYRRTYALDEAGIGAEIRRRVARCLSRQDVIDAVRWFVSAALNADRHDVVMARIEVLGSAASRPTLREAVAEVERANIADIIRVFEVAREHGWVKPTFSGESLAAVWHGIVLASFIPVIAADILDRQDWVSAATEAMLHILFDDPPAR